MSKKLSEDLLSKEKALEEFSNNELPDFIIDKAQDLVDSSFENEQFQDGKSSKWQSRKNDSESSKGRTERRALLIASGDLIISTVATQEGSKIIIGTDTKYAKRHNEGEDMPKRQFMPIDGEDAPFDDEVEKFIDDAMDKILG